MELPFAVEQSGLNNDGEDRRPSPSSLQLDDQQQQQLGQSETDSLVTASSHGSLIDTSGLVEDHHHPHHHDVVDDRNLPQHHPHHHHRQHQHQHPHQQDTSRFSGGVTHSSGPSSNISRPGGGGPLPPNTPQDVVLPSRLRVGDVPPSHHKNKKNDEGMMVGPEADFTYVDVTSDETSADVLLGEGEVVVDLPDTESQQRRQRGDVLTVLLGDMRHDECDDLLETIDHANDASKRATDAKSEGDLVLALEYHTKAAKLYKDNAVVLRDRNPSLASTLLLLSQSQAKSAIAIKRIVKLNPQELRQVFPSSSTTENSGTHTGGRSRSSSIASDNMSQKDRLRAAVRGALGSKHHEADLSDSQFLGPSKDTKSSSSSFKTKQSRLNHQAGEDTRNDQEGTILAPGTGSDVNPVDEMMYLERELREMDMALELGSSVSSLDARMHSRMKNSMVGDGSFMVVPPGSQSYMSSASMWGAPPSHVQSRPAAPSSTTNHGVRARANRVQNMQASSNLANRPHISQAPGANAAGHKPTGGLESSWWGTASTASQILSSSVVSISGGRMVTGGDGGMMDGSSSANTKQIMRLMDSLKILGDENAALMREVEELESARAETKAVREEMKRFKEEYGKRFNTLKRALEKFRKENGGTGNASNNDPVNSSDYIKSASVAEQLQRQEALIRKLTADLKASKEESKKKDSALRKYESFYREVKARSAQKAAQRNQSQSQQPPPHPSQNQQRRKVGGASSSRR